VWFNDRRILSPATRRSRHLRHSERRVGKHRWCSEKVPKSRKSIWDVWVAVWIYSCFFQPGQRRAVRVSSARFGGPPCQGCERSRCLRIRHLNRELDNFSNRQTHVFACLYVKWSWHLTINWTCDLWLVYHPGIYPAHSGPLSLAIPPCLSAMSIPYWERFRPSLGKKRQFMSSVALVSVTRTAGIPVSDFSRLEALAVNLNRPSGLA